MKVERFLIKADRDLTMAQKVAVNKVINKNIMNIRATGEPWLTSDLRELEAFAEGLDREKLYFRRIGDTVDGTHCDLGFTIMRVWWEPEENRWQNACVCSVYVPKLAELTKAIWSERHKALPA